MVQGTNFLPTKSHREINYSFPLQYSFFTSLLFLSKEEATVGHKSMHTCTKNEKDCFQMFQYIKHLFY